MKHVTSCGSGVGVVIYRVQLSGPRVSVDVKHHVSSSSGGREPVWPSRTSVRFALALLSLKKK